MSKLTHSDTDTMLALEIRRMIEDDELSLTPIESSNLRRAGYWADEQILVLEFPNGVYAYQGFPPNMHRKLMDAKSKGAFFAREIRDLYPCIQIPAATPEPKTEPTNAVAAA